MKPLLAALLALALVLPAVEAHTAHFSDEKISLVFPDDWVAVARPGALIAASDPQQVSSAALLATVNDQNVPVDNPGFIAGIKKGMLETAEQQGSKIKFTAESATTINGVSAYVVQYEMVLSTATTLYVTAYAIAGNGKVYVMSMQTLNSTHEYQLQEIANSFRFDSPPTVPHKPLHKADAIRWGTYFVAGLGVLLVIAAFVALVRVLQRKPPPPTDDF